MFDIEIKCLIFCLECFILMSSQSKGRKDMFLKFFFSFEDFELDNYIVQKIRFIEY